MAYGNNNMGYWGNNANNLFNIWNQGGTRKNMGTLGDRHIFFQETEGPSTLDKILQSAGVGLDIYDNIQVGKQAQEGNKAIMNYLNGLGGNATGVEGANPYIGSIANILQGNTAQGIGSGLGTAVGGPVGGAIGGVLGGLFGGGDTTQQQTQPTVTDDGSEMLAQYLANNQTNQGSGFLNRRKRRQ